MKAAPATAAPEVPRLAVTEFSGSVSPSAYRPASASCLNALASCEAAKLWQHLTPRFEAVIFMSGNITCIFSD